MAILQLDGGEGRKYNESLLMVGPQWLLIDKQEGVYAGGRAEYTGIRTFEVLADFHTGKIIQQLCIKLPIIEINVF